MFRFFLSITVLTVLCSCEKKDSLQNTSAENKIRKTEIQQPKTDSLKMLNDEIISVLKSGEYGKLTEFIHPEKGVRFSMYAYVNPEKDKVFTKENFEKYIESEIRFTFGEKDGSGEPLVVSLKEYLKNWVWKRDFTEAVFTENKLQGSGNSLNNLQEIYPNAEFTENHIKGSEKYGGMDWNSLRLVFEKYQGKYFLIAVINDEWTI